MQLQNQSQEVAAIFSIAGPFPPASTFYTHPITCLSTPAIWHFFRIFYFYPSSVHVCDKVVYKAWMGRSETNMQESLSLHSGFQGSHSCWEACSASIFTHWATSLKCLACIVPVRVSIFNICLTTRHFPFLPSHYHGDIGTQSDPTWAGLLSPESISSRWILTRSLVICIDSLLFFSRPPVTNDFHFYIQSSPYFPQQKCKQFFFSAMAVCP